RGCRESPRPFSAWPAAEVGGLSGCRAGPGPSVQDAENLGLVGQAHADLLHGVDLHGLEPAVDGGLVEAHAVGALGGQAAELVGHEHEFVDGQAAAVARPEARLAGLAVGPARACAGGADLAEQAL